MDVTNLRLRPILALLPFGLGKRRPADDEGTPEGHSRVRMINSVATTGGDYIADEYYFIPSSLADSWIIRGYCEGELSREYNAEERAIILAGVQIINPSKGVKTNPYGAFSKR